MGFSSFFVLLVIFSFLDGYTTYIGIKKAQAKEANPIVKAVINAFGLSEGLLIVKAIYLIYVWYNPIYVLSEQLLVLAVLATISISNYLIAKKK